MIEIMGNVLKIEAHKFKLVQSLVPKPYLGKLTDLFIYSLPIISVSEKEIFVGHLN